MEKPGVNEMGEPEAPAPRGAADVYFLFVAASNLVTALVPSETACLASSPGRMRRTAVWTSRLPSVFVFEKRQTLAASLPMRSKRSVIVSPHKPLPLRPALVALPRAHKRSACAPRAIIARF